MIGDDYAVGAESHGLFGIGRMHDTFENEISFPPPAILRHFVPSESAAHLSTREGDELRKRNALAGVSAHVGKSRGAVAPKCHGPCRSQRALQDDLAIDPE